LFFIFHFITNTGLTVNKVEHDMITEIKQEYNTVKPVLCDLQREQLNMVT